MQRRKLATSLLILAVLLFGSVLMSITIIPHLISSQTSWNPVWGVALLLILYANSGLAVLDAITQFRAVAPRIDVHEITPGFRIRRKDGTKTMRIPASEVRGVEPWIVDGYNGVWVTLFDGAKIFLSEQSFPDAGLESLERLCRQFGRQYEQGLERLVLSGGAGFRLQQVRVRKTEGEVISLRQTIHKRSGGVTKKIGRREIARAEFITTPYVGATCLVVLTDGTRFLVYAADARRAHLGNRAVTVDTIGVAG